MAFGKNIVKKRPSNPEKKEIVNQDSFYIDGWHFSKDDKWKLVSHLHKSIRHGKADDAAAAAKWLYHVDSSYARYRMAVIAFEDIAGGSPEVILDSMSGGWKKEDIEAQGGHVFMQEQARKWALAIKDRTANDWVVCTRWLKEYLDKYNIKSLEQQTIDDAISIAWCEKSLWWEKGLSAWRVAGTTKFPNSHLGKFEGDWNKWIESSKNNDVSEIIIKCMEIGTATQKEGSPIFLPFVDCALQKEKSKVIEKENGFIDLGYIGPYSSSSIDKHTSEGKKAIEYYINSNNNLLTWLVWKNIDISAATEMLGKLQFWLEGGVLNKYIHYPTMKKINDDIKSRTQIDTGINGSEFFKLVNNFNDWHEARKKYVKNKTY